MRRILVLITVMTAALSFVGARALFARGAHVDEVSMSSQASRISSTATTIAALEQQAGVRPDDPDLQVALAVAYLKRVRESADPSFYALADRAASRALELRADDPNALVAAGSIAASRHDFAGALRYAERANALEPALLAAYAVRVDALVELGRYDEAHAAAQEMADRRPDYAALTRISYLRELHGDLDGAIAAMREAADRGTGIPQDRAWALVQLGALHLTSGDVEAAGRAFEEAHAAAPDDPITGVGLARLAIAHGDLPEAERLLAGATARLPLPDYIILLGDVLEAQGKHEAAEKQYDTVRAIQQIYAANGVNTGLELAAFDAEHGEATAAFEAAAAAYIERPSVTAADTVAWTAYKAGRIDDARTYMGRAMGLGTQDARLSFHAGMIAAAAGDDDAARRHFADALRMRGALSPVYAAELDAALAVQ